MYLADTKEVEYLLFLLEQSTLILLVQQHLDQLHHLFLINIGSMIVE